MGVTEGGTRAAAEGGGEEGGDPLPRAALEGGGDRGTGGMRDFWVFPKLRSLNLCGLGCKVAGGGEQGALGLDLALEKMVFFFGLT